MKTVPLFLPSEHGFLPPSVELSPPSATPRVDASGLGWRAGHWSPAAAGRVRRIEGLVVAAMIGFFAFGLLTALGVL